MKQCGPVWNNVVEQCGGTMWWNSVEEQWNSAVDR